MYLMDKNEEINEIRSFGFVIKLLIGLEIGYTYTTAHFKSIEIQFFNSKLI